MNGALLRTLAVLAALLAAATWSGSAYAQKRVALVIGNSAYRNAPVLLNPVRDAQAVAAAFEREGFAAVRANYDLDYLAFRRAIREFEDAAAGADIAVVYYSGHALEVDGINYLIPVDARLASTRDAPHESITLERLIEAAKGAKELSLLILDACRDNSFLKSQKLVKAGLVPVVPDGSNMIFAYASDACTDVPDGAGGHSPFTDALLDSLFLLEIDVPATLELMHDRVIEKTGNRQEPYFAGSMDGKSISALLKQVEVNALRKQLEEPKLAGPGAPPMGRRPASISEEQRTWNRVKDSSNPGLLRDFILRYPNSPLVQMAQGKLAAIEREAAAIHLEEERETARLKAEREAALKRIPFKGRDSEPLADLPPPPPATIERFPTIEAARRVAPGAQIVVVVSLTVDKVTPQVTVHATGPSASTSPHGALQIPMPADGSRVVLKVVLHAAGFDFDPGSRNEATITLDRNGDSTSAVFRITARPDAVGEHALRVTFWRDNEFLACASRRIEIIDLPQVASARPEDFRAVRASEDAQLSFSLRPRPIDLKVEVLYDNADGLGHGRVTIASDYLGNLRHGEINTPPAIVDWLAGFYRDFKAAGIRAQLAGDTDEAREARLARLRAFGEELYRRAAPPALQTALSELLANPAVKLSTVQIYSNNPLIPWELMRAPRPDGGSTDFFGIAFALARWHEEDGPRPALRPPQDAQVREVVAIAPTYSGRPALAAQAREIDEIASLLSARRVSGKRADFLALVRNPPSGIVHFAGHGEIAGRSAADRRFAIELEDGPFDVMDWRGVPVARAHDRALFFFNACDVGQAESVAGAVEGWAPAVLARGAAGYIGGLWPLTDDPAARFAVTFYRALSQRLKDHGRASVAEALSDARRLVYQTADPTYLGYAFYGDAQLALVRN
jgi:hypothetical protein